MISQVFIGIAALIHVYIFMMESLLWGRPRVNRSFGLSPEQVEANRLFAFNQGFYNLFLAIAALVGIGLSVRGVSMVGLTLMIYAALSMCGAAGVLICSERKLLCPALIQGLPPLLGLVLLALHL